MEESQKSQQSQTDDSSNTTDNSQSKYERHIVENTPFIIAEGVGENNESIFTVCLGQVRMSELFNSFEECEAWIKEITWDKILQVAICTYESIQKIHNSKVVN